MNGKGAGIDAVIFDVGGVIVRLDDIALRGPFNDRADAAAIRAIWADCPNVRAHERGEISADVFACRMVRDYAIPPTPAEFLERFKAWPREILPGAEELVRDLDSRLVVACLSNTSDVHWQTQQSAEALARLFELQFLSFRIGRMKPDREIYDHVAHLLGIPPARILFFDDTQANAVAAREAGFDGHLVSGPAEARAILQSYGLLRRN